MRWKVTASAAAASITARHFIERGYRKIADVGAQLDTDLCAAQRLEGFSSVLAEAGVSLHRETDQDLPRTRETGQVLTQRLLDRNQPVDAIYCLNDSIAAGCLSYLYSRDFRIPDDVAVAGFNGTSRDYAVRTNLTTQDVDRREIGRCAANLIVDQNALRNPVDLVPDKLVVGTTT
ncbi:substrate-binding domain-containing protein [Ruegeria sp. 2205SS24-7]|uniref:substrate-binding domain-containing protein n=1 Tax=Ruegeria discodermiae TaxID=3064389 RepID=UPI002740E982|nr:substrate-binding domain-containing protein [Ruegeria sp. 2205SS24-7]MDP5218908.1 substrate-binding domain-containing protein [Ruegeria sp. 2205SS24-7]